MLHSGADIKIEECIVNEMHGPLVCLSTSFNLETEDKFPHILGIGKYKIKTKLEKKCSETLG